MTFYVPWPFAWCLWAAVYIGGFLGFGYFLDDWLGEPEGPLKENFKGKKFFLSLAWPIFLIPVGLFALFDWIIDPS